MKHTCINIISLCITNSKFSQIMNLAIAKFIYFKTPFIHTFSYISSATAPISPNHHCDTYNADPLAFISDHPALVLDQPHSCPSVVATLPADQHNHHAEI